MEGVDKWRELGLRGLEGGGLGAVVAMGLAFAPFRNSTLVSAVTSTAPLLFLLFCNSTVFCCESALFKGG